MSSAKTLIFLQINEVNFEAIEAYVAAGLSLPNFKKLLSWTCNTTRSETSYQLLEPWIQWPSVHTGLTFEEHNLFRLGDAALYHPKQIFEEVEAAGYRVGAISPMNAINALTSPAYFIPDPWTDTPSDKSFFSRAITRALRQTVNDNSAGSVKLSSFLFIAYGIVTRVRLKKYAKLLWLALSSKGRPWRKAIFLEYLLNEWHLSLFKETAPNFSTIFFNAGAHIQHHYFLSAIPPFGVVGENPQWYVDKRADPLLEVLLAYDEILGDYIEQAGSEVIVATGLSQQPVSKSVFYYRLRDHTGFLRRLGIVFERVQPRMTRDFLITFSSDEDAEIAAEVLGGFVTADGEAVFGEIDNRGKELFVVLTYPHEIGRDTRAYASGREFDLASLVVFVAVKNGEHIGKGYAYYSAGIDEARKESDMHVSNLYHTIQKFFGLGGAS